MQIDWERQIEGVLLKFHENHWFSIKMNEIEKKFMETHCVLRLGPPVVTRSDVFERKSKL